MTAEPEEIEAEMRAVRDRLEEARDEVRNASRRWRDWRTHFRAHPALIGLGAGALGFLLVPRKGSPALTTIPLQAAAPVSPLARIAAAGLKIGLQQVLPLVMAVAAERLQRGRSLNQVASDDGEAKEPVAPRKPR